MAARTTSSALFADWPTKLAALGVAILLWAAVTVVGSRTVTVENVPITLTNVPQNLGPGDGVPTVTVRLRVSRTVTAEHPQDLLRAFADVSGGTIGERIVTVSATPTRPNVDVLGITPSTISVTLDPVVPRVIPVRVVPLGTPADGYTIGELKAVPDRVKVSAPLGIVDKLTGVDAEVAVDKVSSTVNADVTLKLFPGVTADPARVYVTAAIEQSDVTKVVGVRVLTKGTPAAGYFIQGIATTPATVTVHGAQTAVASATTIDTAPVDVTNASANVSATPTLVIPDGLTLVEGITAVQAQVIVAPLSGTKVVNANITTTNVPDGLRVSSLSPGSVQVTLRGDANAISRVKDSDVRISVDVGNKGSGSFSMKPTTDNVQTPSGVQAVAIEQRDVNITLQ